MTATAEPPQDPDAEDEWESEAPSTERDMEDADTANGERPPAGE